MRESSATIRQLSLICFSYLLQVFHRGQNLIPHSRTDLHLANLVDEAHDSAECLARLGGVLGKADAQDRIHLPLGERVPQTPLVARPGR